MIDRKIELFLSLLLMYYLYNTPSCKQHPVQNLRSFNILAVPIIVFLPSKQ